MLQEHGFGAQPDVHGADGMERGGGSFPWSPVIGTGVQGLPPPPPSGPEVPGGAQAAASAPGPAGLAAEGFSPPLRRLLPGDQQPCPPSLARART